MGYIQQDFKITCLFLAVGSGVSAAVCLPDWPWWNRHPLEWLPARSALPASKRRSKDADRKHAASDGAAAGSKAAAAGGGTKKGGKSKKA